MLRYAVNRVVWTIPVVLLAITLTFFLVRATGGDPFRHGPLVGLTAQGGWQKYGDWQPQSIRDNMRRRYGLDLPWYEQYANYVVGVTTFNLGPSLSFRNRTVEDVVARQGPITLQLALLALAWGVLAGIAAGVGSALARRGSPVAHLERTVSSLALAVPAFFVGTLAIALVAVKWGLLPTSGWGGWETKVLPAFTLGLVPMAYCARLTRGAMAETLGEDYVRSARAKGLRRRGVVRHALRNSLVPVLSAAGPLLGGMITTLFVVEYVFAVPGLARHYVSAATARDYPLLMGMTVVFTLAVVVANLVVDLLLAWLDPRLRERRSAAG